MEHDAAAAALGPLQRRAAVELPPASATLAHLSPEHRHGLIAIGVVAAISFAATGTLFAFLTYKLLDWNLRGGQPGAAALGRGRGSGGGGIGRGRNRGFPLGEGDDFEDDDDGDGRSGGGGGGKGGGGHAPASPLEHDLTLGLAQKQFPLDSKRTPFQQPYYQHQHQHQQQQRGIAGEQGRQQEATVAGKDPHPAAAAPRPPLKKGKASSSSGTVTTATTATRSTTTMTSTLADLKTFITQRSEQESEELRKMEEGRFAAAAAEAEAEAGIDDITGSPDSRRDKSGRSTTRTTATTATRTRTKGRRRRRRAEQRNPFPLLIYNLLLAELHTALGYALNVSWAARDGVFVGTATCWAQGWLDSVGIVASSLFFISISMLTYLAVVWGWRPRQRVAQGCVALTWAAALVLVTAGIIHTRNGRDSGGWFVRADAWCWVNSAYPKARLWSCWAWVLVSIPITVVLYSLTFWSLWSEGRSSRHLPSGAPLADDDTSNNNPNYSMAPPHHQPAAPPPKPRPSGHHPAFFWYPLIYLACTAPLAVARLVTTTAEADGVAAAAAAASSSSSAAAAAFLDSGSVTVYCVVGSLVAANGLLNTVLWSTTILVSTPQDIRDTGLDRFRFIKTPRERRYGNIVWIQGRQNSVWGNEDGRGGGRGGGSGGGGGGAGPNTTTTPNNGGVGGTGSGNGSSSSNLASRLDALGAGAADLACAAARSLRTWGRRAARQLSSDSGGVSLNNHYWWWRTGGQAPPPAPTPASRSKKRNKSRSKWLDAAAADPRAASEESLRSAVAAAGESGGIVLDVVTTVVIEEDGGRRYSRPPEMSRMLTPHDVVLPRAYTPR